MKMDDIVENRLIDQWVRGFTGPANRVNAAHEADAELVEMPGCPDSYLAVTIDTVAEEIAAGVYRDPFTAGWVSIVASLSDLSAVGADPLGLVVAVTLDQSRSTEYQSGVAEGMEAACRAGGTAILGGDTNFGDRTILTGCALGLVPRQRVMTRRGCSAGDIIYASGRFGAGNALGLARLAGLPDAAFPENLYRPAPRLAEGRLLREHAGCCMDSSDGLFATLDQLMRINGIGISVDCEWDRLLAPEVSQLCQATGTPGWSMAAGPHGEFELIAAVPPATETAFLTAARAQGMGFMRVGEVRKNPGLLIRLRSGKQIPVDAAPFRNLLFTVGADMKRYMKEFLALGAGMGLE